MSRHRRRLVWTVALIAFTIIPAQSFFLDAAQLILGESLGADFTEFLRLQKETPMMAALVVLALDWAYRVERSDEGWSWSPVALRRFAVYALVVVLILVTGFEESLYSIFDIVVADDFAASLATYLHRTIESSLAMLALLFYLDWIVGMRRPRQQLEQGLSYH